MRKLITAASLALAVASSSAATPTQESIEALIDASGADQAMESVYPAIEASMRQTLRQTGVGLSMSAEASQRLDELPARMTAVMRSELSWQQMKPLYVQLYQETYSQDEVDGLLAFYRSPAGRAFVAKTPVLVQKSMTLIQTRMQALMPKMIELMSSTSAASVPTK